MIGTLSIKINAANPNIPLKTLFAYVNSPSSIRIIDVPKKIGKWNITQVIVSATYPDNTIVSSSCVLTGGCWTGTIQGSSSVGKSLNGYTISANGIDENGNPMEGLVLGKGDVVILDADGRTIIDGKVTYLHLIEGDIPEDPKEGDVILQDGNWKIYHNDDWIDFGGKNPSWGIIEGNIEDQTDLIDKFDDVDLRLGDIEGDVSNVKSNVSTLSANLISTQNELADAKRDIDETNDRIDNLSADYNTTKNDVAGIKSKIPNAASTENQLADKAFVNSSINNFAAFYITKNANGDAFATKAELMGATVYYSGGQVRVPTKNDYTIVLEDETKTTSLGVNPTTRYSYNNQWEYQYIVNNTALTQAQVNAINSGITKDIVDNRVLPSTSNPGYAENADNAEYARLCDGAITAQHAYNADYAAQADSAGFAADAAHSQYSDGAAMAESAGRAENATNADSARYADNAQYADIAYQAYSSDYATYAPDYTPLSTYNALLSGYASTLLSGVTSDDQTVSFYILTKNA